jgi:FtsP/CotA-like multicopper oxidase with cupredoxin domain
MFEPLFLTDMVLALAVMTVAMITGRRAGRLLSRPADTQRALPRLTLALYGMAALILIRLVVVGLIGTGGLSLTTSRLSFEVLLAAVPAVVAMVAVWRGWSPERISMAAHATAVGGALSAIWLYIPFAQASPLIALIASLLAMGMSVALARWRAAGSRGSRAPWLTLLSLLVPAIALGLAYQDNQTAMSMDWGGGAVPAHDHHSGGARSVEQLTGPRDGTPDARFTLTAAQGKVRLASGRQVDALTFNGQSPGPAIRVLQGRLVEVTLVNVDVREGVTVHWHGVDVPNAEDGVPGVTQEAVMPGGRHVYRFVPDRPGTFWYHTHRDSSKTVERGLFGALIVEDHHQAPEKTASEKVVFTHLWPGADDPIPAFDTADQPSKQAVAAGEPVLLRFVNSSEEPQRLHLSGVAYTVTAIDGNQVQGGTPVPSGTDLLLAAGGRYDAAFTMPDGTVTVSLDTAEFPGDAALAFSPTGQSPPAALGAGPLFDPLTYGTGTPPAQERYDRTFDIGLDDGFGFAQGRFNYVSSSINGRLYPAVPMLMVDEGDRVKVRISNRSLIDHPMHLHGHRVRVLSRNGVPSTGSPWWTDTLNVAPGEVFEVAFTADNPGLWMDHCHNFKHASEGMIMHLGYADVTTPYTEDHIPE